MKKIYIFIAVWIIVMADSAFAGETLIVSGHPEYPPIMWQEDNTITGVAIKLAETVFKELKVPYKIEYSGPWKHVQMNARKGSVDVIAAAYMNRERQTYMDYTISFMKDPVVVFINSDGTERV